MDYIEYVRATIEKYREAVRFLGPGQNEIYPEDINRVLANYADSQLVLIGEYQRVNREYFFYKRKFDSWWNGIFNGVRQRMKGQSRYSSVKEIEVAAREEVKEEYDRQEGELLDLENKKDFLKQVLDSWKNFESVITALSYNMRAEMRSISIDRRVNGGNAVRDKLRIGGTIEA